MLKLGQIYRVKSLAKLLNEGWILLDFDQAFLYDPKEDFLIDKHSVFKNKTVTLIEHISRAKNRYKIKESSKLWHPGLLATEVRIRNLPEWF
jgi:hypothetical protein